MSQNRSTAVMAQRKEPADSLDDFPTQPWGTRALMEHIITPLCRRYNVPVATCWEPAANRGYMFRPLTEYFPHVYGSDVHDYGAGFATDDFTFAQKIPENAGFSQPDWVITNPPFMLAEEFISHGLSIAKSGVAVLVRSSFVEGIGRYRRLYRYTPPFIIAPFVERLPLVKGRVDPRATTATSYSWMVWLRKEKNDPHVTDTHTVWIPPCRKGLERPGDYDTVINYRSAGLRAGAPAAQENQAAILPADRVGITGNGDTLAQNSVTGTRNAHGCAARPCHPKPDAARVPGIPLRHQAGSTQSTTVAGGKNANP